MILMNLKLDNYMAFHDFEMNMSYPKKIVGNPMIENLKDYPKFRYRKLNILMGSNASGKTSIGKMLMCIFNFINQKEFNNLLSFINDTTKAATFEVQIVMNDNFYRITSIVKGKDDEEDYTSDNFLIKVDKIEINKADTYEKCVERLERKSSNDFNQDYIRELEKVEKLSWAFEFPMDSRRVSSKYIPENEERYLCILKNTLQALDPLISDVEKVKEVKDTYVIHLGNDSIIIKNGSVIGGDKLSSGTKEGISIANMYVAMVCGGYDFFYCDEKFSYVHSDIEKAFLSLMVQKLEGDSQLFFTTHNTDILDMDFPKHSYNFLRKEIYDNDCYISVVNAGDYVKKNSDSVKNAVQNDLFSSAPMLEKVFALANI